MNLSFTEDIEPADFADLDANANLTENEVRFFPPFPTVLRGKPGNDFENLTLKMDSVSRNFCNDSTFIIAEFNLQDMVALLDFRKFKD
ncbi:hypothetical protein Avbf_01850 [Armadillidium vulgare]|nr:hypothetical protein Avbf_01850 [Armadillidium vulgare]